MEQAQEPAGDYEQENGICCDYCFNSNPEQLVMCIICKRWFCNSVLVGSGSHAYLHMTTARHFKVKAHEQSKYGGRRIRCSKCKNENVFDLRAETRNPTSLTKLMCLSKCLATQSLKNPAIADKWYPIVDEKRFSSSLFSVDPNPGYGAVELSKPLISQYERMCEVYPGIKITTVELKPQPKLQPIPLSFQDSAFYFNAFEPLIKLEDSEQKLRQQNDGEKHVRGEFAMEEQGRKEIITCEFFVHQYMFSRDISIGDQLSLTYCIFQEDLEEDLDAVSKVKPRKHFIDEMDLDDLRNMQDNQDDEEDGGLTDMLGEMNRKNRIDYIGEVLNVRSIDAATQLVEITLQVMRAHGPENKLYDDGYFDIRLKDRGSVVERRLYALQQLDEDSSMHQDIWEVLMGVTRHMNKTAFFLSQKERTQNYDAPNMKPLNESQRIAVVKALSQRFSLIQGPPGTGKTNTAAALVYHLVQRAKNKQYDIPIEKKELYGDAKRCRQHYLKTPGKILVCVPSNVAADEICKRIHRTGVNVVRVMALSKQKDESPIQELCLHTQVDELLMNEESARGEDYRALKKSSTLTREKSKQLYGIKWKVEQELINKADVVVSTCDSSGNSVLREVVFHTVLVDEASQAVEPEILVALVHGAERVIIVGDQKQLEPVVLNGRCRMNNYARTLMDRLVELGFVPHMLDTQYRMHPTLAEFPNNTYYDGLLKNGVTEVNRPIQPGLPYVVPDRPLLFYHVEGREGVGSMGTSFINMQEAVSVVELIKILRKQGVREEKIGVITSYAGQKLLLQNLTIQAKLEVEVATVNTFQGREKDYIIYSCVRSNPSNVIGFLNNPRRLNVALTRARFGMFVVGNAKMLAGQGDCGKYVDYHLEHETIARGTLGRLIVIDQTFFM